MKVKALAFLLVPFNALVFAAGASSAGRLCAQQPLWANDLVPNQAPSRNAVPAKDDPALATDNGSDNAFQEELRRLARIHDDQTSQDTGDPVLPTIGLVSHRAVDLYIEGRGLDFSFERRYNSKRSDTDGPLGFGWDHCYNARIQGGGSLVTVHDGNGGQDQYVQSGPSAFDYNSPPGVYTLARFQAPSIFVLRNREGIRTYFSQSTSQLTKIEDPAGNALTFYYDELSGHLDHVIDTMGRTITFSYNGDGRLWWITDFRGRQVEYSYDAEGNLAGVRTPTVTSTAGFNDFPNGRAERYTYLSGLGNSLDHKLTSIVRPNDVTQAVPPYGTPAVQFAYETDPDAVFFGWCTSQTLGGTNAAGTAGGTITYDYSVLDFTTAISDSNALNIGRLKTQVTNRKGFVTEYTTNQNGHVIKVVDFNGSTPFTTANEYNADGELTKITQPNGNYTTPTYATGIRHVAGNIASITHHSGSIPSDQTTRTMLLEYEPIFNNLSKVTDFRGYETRYFTDYQEGETLLEHPNDVVPLLQAELLNIFTQRQQILDMFAGSSVTFENFDLNGDGLQPVARGNVIVTENPAATISGLGGSPLAVLEGDATQESWLTRTYNSYGQVTSETNEEVNVTVYLYYPESDPDGDGNPTPGGGLNTTMGGYLKRIVEDTSLPYADSQLTGVTARTWDVVRNSGTNPPPVNKTTDYFYDPSGNVTAVLDPRGVRYEYSVTELDEVWKERRATDVSAALTRGGGLAGSNEDLSGPAFSYSKLWRMDSNGNVIAHFVQNAGGWSDDVAVAGAPSGHFEEYWTYDILDNERTEAREYGFAGEPLATWTFGYDTNENQISVTFPEENGEFTTWDFRDQVASITRGSGPEFSQETFTRDSNGNLRQYTDGRVKHTIYDYDGFDRVKRVLEPAGTERKLVYDAESNVTSMSIWGRIGGPSPVGNDTSQNIELQKRENKYDQRNRLIQIDRQDPQAALTDGSLTPNDGKVSTVLNHDRLSRTIYIIDDDMSRTERLYDGATRKIKETDPVENIVEFGYDDNDNLVKTVEKDIYPNASYRQFEYFNVVDALNRIKSTTDNIGRTDRFGYDSRDNLINRSDAVASLSSQSINERQVNNPGNTTTIKVDGLGRVVKEESELRVGGTGDGALDSPAYNPDGRSTRTFTYDKNSRVCFATDDKGNATEYQYDTLDRLQTAIYANGTQLTRNYDGNDNVVFWQDAVGSQVYITYDDKNRPTAGDATIPSSVVGTTKIRYEYDGLDRLTKSIDSVDNQLGNGNDWVNEYTWDALNRKKIQSQNNRAVTTAWREESKKTSIGYTSGVTIQYAYDALERATSVTQGAQQLASYSYAGKDRLLERTDNSGVAQRYHDGTWNDTSYYDGARRPTKVDFKKGAVLLTGIEHGFDRANNRLYTRRLHHGSRGDNFVYDSMYRLTLWEEDVAATWVGTPGGTSFDSRTTFELDGAQSRRRFTKATADDEVPVPTVITVNNVHNYVSKKKGFGPFYTITNQAFDLNGNKTAFTDQGAHSVYKYDFLNRLRVIEKESKKVEFEYDAEGKRVRTRVTGLGGYPAITEFMHDGQHVIEELDGSGACLRRFYYGDNLDELVGYENLAFYPGTGTYFYEQDSASDVIAIHDVAGIVVERYSYGAFGFPTFETPLSVEKSVGKSDFGNPYLFKGLRYEAHFNPLYYVRARFQDPNDGTFMQRDPIGIWGDRVNVGNSKTYCGSNPVNWIDPLGLQGVNPFDPTGVEGRDRTGAQRPRGGRAGVANPTSRFSLAEQKELARSKAFERAQRDKQRRNKEIRKKQEKVTKVRNPKSKPSKHRPDGKYDPGGTTVPLGPVSEHNRDTCPKDCPAENPGMPGKYGIPPAEEINNGPR